MERWGKICTLYHLLTLYHNSCPLQYAGGESKLWFASCQPFEDKQCQNQVWCGYWGNNNTYCHYWVIVCWLVWSCFPCAMSSICYILSVIARLSTRVLTILVTIREYINSCLWYRCSFLLLFLFLWNKVK